MAIKETPFGPVDALMFEEFVRIAQSFESVWQTDPVFPPSNKCLDRLAQKFGKERFGLGDYVSDVEAHAQVKIPPEDQEIMHRELELAATLGVLEQIQIESGASCFKFTPIALRKSRARVRTRLKRHRLA